VSSTVNKQRNQRDEINNEAGWKHPAFLLFQRGSEKQVEGLKIQR
jgi:hypothetical protein